MNKIDFKNELIRIAKNGEEFDVLSESLSEDELKFFCAANEFVDVVNNFNYDVVTRKTFSTSFNKSNILHLEYTTHKPYMIKGYQVTCHVLEDIMMIEDSHIIYQVEKV